MSVSRRDFLGVRRSANGVRWESRLDERHENIALDIAQTHGTGDVVARVLAGRGVTSADLPGFLDPTIRELMPDPATLTDMDIAGDRIARAVLRRERVAVFGDYDVDGAASSAMLARFLRHFGNEVEIYIPDRIFEGYGPNPEAMRDLAARGASLVVTVDCGASSHEAIAAANAAGADVVVLDHHQMGAQTPPAVAVVNPNRQDDLSGLGHLCAGGIVFMTLVEVSRQLRAASPALAMPDLLELTDLAALATVCDVVPLKGLNRAFVVKGLAAMRKMGNAGIAALHRVSRIGEPLNPYHLGFMIGPRINAGGRIGDAALGARLLSTDDPEEASTIAATLDRLNDERQQIERRMLEEARAEADAEMAGGLGPSILVTESEDWHPGVVGLLAARLKEYARRPAFAIAFNASGVGTGSGRSIAGFDLGRLVREAVDQGLLVKGGGHAMAAGITVQRARLGDLRAFFEAQSAQAVGALREADALRIDAAIAAECASSDLVDTVEKAGPFGQGHPQPVYACPRHRVADVREVGTGHIRVALESGAGGRLQAIAFRAAETDLGRFLGQRRGAVIHVAGTLGINHWNGGRSVQLRLIDAADPV